MRRLNIFTMIFVELDIAIFVFYVYTISIFIKMKVSLFPNECRRCPIPTEVHKGFVVKSGIFELPLQMNVQKDRFSAPRRLLELEEGSAECRQDYMSTGLRE